MSGESAGVTAQWDASLYDGKHGFIWQYGAGVLELLAPQPGERIIDLGCGTGHLAAQIAASGATVVGLDSAPTMVEQARRSYPALRFEVADATSFDVGRDFDALFSNATLHWVRPPEAAAACMFRALRPGGRLVAELGGRGNVRLLTGALIEAMRSAGIPAGPERARWYFPSISEYTSLLEATGFEVVYAALIDRPTRFEEGEQGLRNWYRMFAAHLLDGIPTARHDEIFAQAEQLLRPQIFRDGAWFGDYRRLRLIATTPHA